MDSPLVLIGSFALFSVTLFWLEHVVPLAPPVRDRRRTRLRANVGITLVMLAVGGLAGGIMIGAADYAADHEIGLFHQVDVAPWLRAVLAVFALELSYWALHLVEHKVPALWRLHRAHHTDPDVDVTTSIRSNPLDFVLLNIVQAALVVVPLGVGKYLVAVYSLFNLIITVIQHARVALPPRIDTPLRAVLMTPSLHRMHHSASRAQTDSNYGGVTSVFDHLFRTASRPDPQVVCGLDVADLAQRQSVRAMLLEPLRPV